MTGHRVVRIEDERSPGEDVGTPLVIALEGDPGQPDDGDRVARIGRNDLGVQALRLVEQTHRQCTLCM
jgi:hypothetical protein